MTYQRIGKHRVTNASVESPVVDLLFDDGRKADVLYSDPPWGDGNVGYWATKASKDTGEPVPRITYEALISRIFGLIRSHVAGYVFIETGFRWEEDTRARMAQAGVREVDSVTLKYRSGSKWLENVLIAGTIGGGMDHVLALTAVAGGHGPAVARECIARTVSPGGIVLDPCCGMGYTAQAAVDAGAEFRGNELNPVRLAKTIRRLEKA